MPAPARFVGREQELARLQAALRVAASGCASAVMLVGEPGIGKTRTAEEFERLASAEGALVLWGRSRESAGAPPYWPWTQIGRAARARIEPDDWRALVGTDAVELQRLLPELRQTIPDLPPAPEHAEAGTAWFELYEALTSFVRRLAERQPVVVVLEDLHWADRPTLLLLTHLAAEAAESRLLVVGTYREHEIVRGDPLSEALVALGRHPGVERLTLRGLNTAETAEYVREAWQGQPDDAVIQRAYELTEGNPFFLGEVLQLLGDPAAATGSTGASGVPQGVRAVLGQRLDRLSDPALELLRFAAVAGREFTYETLSALDAGAPEDSLPSLEEALAAAIIEETASPGRHRFTHALMQETVLAELSSTRRAQMHGRIGDVLERRWSGVADERAARLAYHFVEAAAVDASHAPKAFRYARLAGEQAEAQYGWDEAVRWYGHALALLPGDDGRGRAELLLAAGRCMLYLGQYREAMRSFMRALTLFEEQRDGMGAARTALAALNLEMTADRREQVIDTGLRALGDADPTLKARLLARRASWPFGDARADEAAAETARIGEELGLSDVKGMLLERDFYRAVNEGRLEDAVLTGEQVFIELDAAGLHRSAGLALYHACVVRFVQGDLAAEDRMLERLGVWSHRLRSIPSVQEMHHDRALHAYVRGDLVSAEHWWSTAPPGMFALDLSLARLLAERGDERRALELRETVPVLNVPHLAAQSLGGHAYVFYLAGDAPNATDAVTRCVDALDSLPRNDLWLWIAFWYVQDAVVLLDDARAARTAAALAATHFEQTSRVRGVLALRLGDVVEAQSLLLAGLEFARRHEWPIERALCLRDLAMVAERCGNAAGAREYLEEAAALFEEYGMLLYLQQVRARLDALAECSAAEESGPAPDGLSPREREVLSLLAGGCSNREIADELVISVHTVERHVANIYAKAGVRSRSQATIYAVRRGIAAADASQAGET